MTFAETLKDLREEQGITQTLLAAYCKVSTQCISALEKGTRNPTGTTLVSLANYFNVSIDYLMGRTDDLGATIPTAQDLSRDEQEVLELYAALSPSRKEDLMIFLRALSGTKRVGRNK